MAVQTKHRFSTQDYHRMAETGVLRPDARVELLNGQIIDMLPIGPFHGGLVNRLIRLFTTLSGGRWLVAAQNPVRLDDYSEPEPDLMLLRPEPGDYTRRHPGPKGVYLLVEVSDTTLDLDRGEKLAAYGRAGIGEVWIVNLVDETTEVHREPDPGWRVRPRTFGNVAGLHRRRVRLCRRSTQWHFDEPGCQPRPRGEDGTIAVRVGPRA